MHNFGIWDNLLYYDNVKTPSFQTHSEGWEGASCCPGAISSNGQHEADLFVMPLYYVRGCCQWLDVEFLHP